MGCDTLPGMKTQPFEVIPVLDIRHGQAVRAVAGDRANYQPLITPLASTAEPLAVALGYRRLFPFQTLYLADLDGIEGRGLNSKVAAAISAHWSDLDIWTDNGSFDEQGVGLLLERDNATAVVGSESGVGTSDLQRLIERFGESIVLSLDFAGDDFTGANKLLADASRWPRRIIVMTLGRVGTNRGPDLERLEEIARRAGPSRLVYAAGGVRDRDDLLAVRAAGASGALVASALHSGQIKTGGLL